MMTITDKYLDKETDETEMSLELLPPDYQEFLDYQQTKEDKTWEQQLSF